jgi:hypothetical protein
MPEDRFPSSTMLHMIQALQRGDEGDRYSMLPVRNARAMLPRPLGTEWTHGGAYLHAEMRRPDNGC